MPEPQRDYYIDEQLEAAIDYLATAPDRIKERLEGIASTRLAVLNAEKFPEPLQEFASSVFQRLDSAEPSGSEGSFVASIRRMSEDEASQLATDILTLSFRHKRYWRDRGQGG